jgi:type III secretion protein J
MTRQRPQSRAGMRRRLLRPLLLACLLTLSACKVDLYSHLDEIQATQMEAILLENGISADRRMDKDQTVTVRVDDSRFADAVEMLKARGYPRQTFSDVASIFNGNGLIVSPTEESAKMMYAISEELGKTISSIDGVLTARVHIVLAEEDLLHQDSKPSSAAVFIRYSETAPVEKFLPQIKMLVANSVSGLTYDRVSVILVPVAPPPPPRLPIPSLGMEVPSLPLPVLLCIGLLLLVAGGAAGAFLRRQVPPKLKLLE